MKPRKFTQRYPRARPEPRRSKFTLRMPMHLYQRIIDQAAAKHMSINDWIREKLEREI
jgi:predicted HicB family RNase H-like nuclease